jgi:hypothetical protein
MRIAMRRVSSPASDHDHAARLVTGTGGAGADIDADGDGHAGVHVVRRTGMEVPRVAKRSGDRGRRWRSRNAATSPCDLPGLRRYRIGPRGGCPVLMGTHMCALETRQMPGVWLSRDGQGTPGRTSVQLADRNVRRTPGHVTVARSWVTGCPVPGYRQLSGERVTIGVSDGNETAGSGKHSLAHGTAFKVQRCAARGSH